MKINCDVCNKDEASVFCSADDAALCGVCDHRVHHANVLAGKHPRFSLLPSPKDSPLCDICQEKKALLFCQQDRAVLCKDCDVAIHKVNEHTMNHCRFLLTGVKLSPTALLSTTRNDVVIPNLKPKFGEQEQVHVKKHVAPIVNEARSRMNTKTAPKSNGAGHGSGTASSISEYLIKTLPGWHVEDFLDSPPTFFEEDDPTVFWDDELLKGSLNDCFSHETMGIWVPQAPQPSAPPPPPPAPPPQPLHHDSYDHLQPYSNMGFGSQMISGSSLVFAPINLNKISKSNEKRRFDDGNCFTVPQISPPAMAKRSRLL